MDGLRNGRESKWTGLHGRRVDTVLRTKKKSIRAAPSKIPAAGRGHFFRMTVLRILELLDQLRQGFARIHGGRIGETLNSIIDNFV